jgi:hypothetical protein
MSLLYKRVLYCEGGTFWSHEVANKHHTESSGQATPPVCRYTTLIKKYFFCEKSGPLCKKMNPKKNLKNKKCFFDPGSVFL